MDASSHKRPTRRALKAKVDLLSILFNRRCFHTPTVLPEFGGLCVGKNGLCREEGRKQGRNEGRKEGRQEGRKEGREGGREEGSALEQDPARDTEELGSAPSGWFPSEFTCTSRKRRCPQ